MFIGLQGAGKSSHYRSHYARTHELVSKDLLRNARDRNARQLRLVAAALAAGHSVVVDNTNATPEDRSPLIDLGHRFGARVVACFFDVPTDVCLARNRVRDGAARVPDVAIFATARRLCPPTRAEGFDDVVTIRDESEAA